MFISIGLIHNTIYFITLIYSWRLEVYTILFNQFIYKDISVK